MIKLSKPVLRRLSCLSKRVIKAFKTQKHFKGYYSIGNLTLTKTHTVPVVIADVFLENNKPRSDILAVYCVDTDSLYVFRSLIQFFKNVPDGAMTQEHWVKHCLAHEAAHAMAQKCIVHMPLKIHQSHTIKSAKMYNCQDAEFDAEMAAIVSVDVPFLKRKNNWIFVLASYLGACYPQIRCWKQTELVNKMVGILKHEMKP